MVENNVIPLFEEPWLKLSCPCGPGGASVTGPTAQVREFQKPENPFSQAKCNACGSCLPTWQEKEAVPGGA